MTFGGVHERSRVSVIKSSALGVDASASLWFAAARAGNRQMNFQTFALEQASMASTTWGFWSPQRTAVVCAWTAVEVLSPLVATLLLGGATCPVKEPTKAEVAGCNRVRDGVVCSPDEARLAYVCKGGQISGGMVCATPNTVCVPNWDYTARTKADGTLDCDVAVQASPSR